MAPWGCAMGEVVAALGVPHTPLLWRLLNQPVPSDLVEVADAFREFRRRLVEARPDVLIVVASDHFRQLSTANMPAFMIGKADSMRGTHPNEERAFGLPSLQVGGYPALATAVLGRHQLAGGFDFSFSDEPWLDHGFVVPLLYLTPELNVPVVPIHTNSNAPPIPPASRFHELGRHLRAVVDGQPGALRVAVVASCHLAYELGGPRQFLGRSPDSDFDAAVVRRAAEGDAPGLIDICSYERMLEAGNLTFQVLNLITCLGAAGDRPAAIARPVACRFGNEPFFAWNAS